MHRSSRAASVAAAVMLALVGCTPTPATENTPTTTVTPTVTPTPTAEVLKVAPGGVPPVAFRGDCGAVLTEAQISDATGLALHFESGSSSGTMANVGGLGCVWRGESATLAVEVIPQSGVGDAALPADSEKHYFEDCDPQWVCSWHWESDELWVAGTFQFAPDMTRANVDRWGAALGSRIGASFVARPDEPWVRDRTGWWPALECQMAADAVGRELGTALVGVSTGLGDPPSPGYAMAGVASERSDCRLALPDSPDYLAYLSTASGTGASTPDDYQPIDLGVEGIESFAGGTGPYGGSQFYLTDAVNSAWVEVRGTKAHLPEPVATAVARAAASGFE